MSSDIEPQSLPPILLLDPLTLPQIDAPLPPIALQQPTLSKELSSPVPLGGPNIRPLPSPPLSAPAESQSHHFEIIPPTPPPRNRRPSHGNSVHWAEDLDTHYLSDDSGRSSPRIPPWSGVPSQRPMRSSMRQPTAAVGPQDPYSYHQTPQFGETTSAGSTPRFPATPLSGGMSNSQSYPAHRSSSPYLYPLASEAPQAFEAYQMDPDDAYPPWQQQQYHGYMDSVAPTFSQASPFHPRNASQATLPSSHFVPNTPNDSRSVGRRASTVFSNYTQAPAAVGLGHMPSGSAQISSSGHPKPPFNPQWRVFHLQVFRGASHRTLKIKPDWDDEDLLRGLKKTYDDLRSWRKFFSLRDVGCVSLQLNCGSFYRCRVQIHQLGQRQFIKSRCSIALKD